MRILLVGLTAIAAVGIFVYASKSKTAVKVKQEIVKPFIKEIPTPNSFAKVKKHAASIKPYLKENNYCEEYCFLIDMKIASGKKRFFVYDLAKDTIADAGLVTHGGGSETNSDSLKFNNISGGNATSIGKYKIGVEYSGTFGMAFKLHGLDASNSRAFERFVVLHSHSCVPTDDVDPSPICTSLGCPTVNPSFLPTLKKYIDKADKPVILWIFY